MSKQKVLIFQLDVRLETKCEEQLHKKLEETFTDYKIVLLPMGVRFTRELESVSE